MKTYRSKRLPLALALACALTAAAAVARAALPSAAPDCEGNACAQVTLTWDAGGGKYRAHNAGSRRARVEAFNWAGGCSVLVEPGASQYLPLRSFDGPYRANFE
jgi:hypothetical protein